MKTEILRCLREADGYVSGQELCERLKVSRTAVWKVIRQLQAEGYEIEAVRNRGYCLKETGDAYTQEELQSVMSSRWAGKNLYFFDEVDSTNNMVRTLAEQGAPEGTLVVAANQTAGKGRRGRTWVAPAGSSVMMSILLRPEFAPERASMLTLVTAMAVARGIREVTGIEAGIKWPNDIVADGKKLCGILTEMSTEMDYIRYVVIGIGINVSIKEFPEELRQKATSLELCLGHPVKRAMLIDACMRAFEDCYEKYLETLDLTLLMEEYNRELVNREREVLVLTPAGDYAGVSHGVNRDGELIVELADGEIRNVVSGEVSVRGIYGYV